MKVFIAGASGAIGSRLVPLLRAHGYEVAAMTRSEENARALRRLGAESVIADGLDRDGVKQAVRRARPDVVVHQMTSLAGVSSLKKLDEALAPTNRLRREGTGNLLAAARAAGVRRFVAQSYGLWAYEGASPATEEQAHLVPPPTMRQTLEAIQHVEAVVPAQTELDGVVLRYGLFYGPGTSIAHDGSIVGLLRERKWPVVGDGSGIWSFIHVDDAAEATLAAIEGGAPGVYNVADDEPATTATWLPALAQAVGAGSPRHVPAWIGRVAAGEAAVYLSTRIRGLSNAKAKRDLGWSPGYGSWREGFATGLGERGDVAEAA